MFGKKKHTASDQISDLFFQNSEEKDSNRNDVSYKTSSTDKNGYTTTTNAKNAETVFLFAATACVILVVIIILINMSHKKNKKGGEELTKNTSVFSDLISLETPISRYLGTTDIVNAVLSGKSTITGTLNLENLKDAGSNISGTALDFDFKHSAKSKELGLYLDVKYRNANALSVNSYADANALLFKIPSKSDKLYSVNYDKLVDRIQKNYQEETGSDDFETINHLISKDSLLKAVGDWSELYGGTDIISSYLYAIRETYPKDYQKIITGINMTEADIDSFGNRGMTYTLSEESVETLVKCILTITLEDENLYDRFYPLLFSIARTYSLKSVDILPDSTNDTSENHEGNNTDTTATDISVIFDDLLYNLQSTAQAFAIAYSDTLSFTVWKNADGMLVGVKSNNVITIGNNVITLEFNIDTQNELNPFDNVKINLLIQYDSATFNFTFERTTTQEEVLVVNNNLYFDLNGQGAIEINNTETLDTSDNSYENQMAVKLPDEANNISVMCTGTFSNISAGHSFDFAIKKLYINEAFTNLLTLNGNMSVVTNKADIKKLSGKKVEITDLSDEEINTLIGR